MSRVIIIGAGIIGAATAFYASRAGLDVTIIERDLPASGTSSRCEGNILISDKELGPELELARLSISLWGGELAEFGHMWEYEAKGGIIVASQESSAKSLQKLVETQLGYGIDARPVDPDQLHELEPNLTPEAVGGAFYPEDCQVQPMLATGGLIKLARDHGATLHTNTVVNGFLRHGDRVTGVRTDRGDYHGDYVVNATGTWAGSFAELAGVNVPVLPRKGYVMVTEPMPPMIHHKVYAAEYVDNVGSSDSGLQCSPVIEGTPAGNILIGSSRERVGFDSTVNTQALKTIASNAIALFPFLQHTAIMRQYHGFRPYCPDHLPVIGPDPRAPGLWHACGHEGAGIGLAAGTGKILIQALTEQTPDLSLEPFAPERFGELSTKEVAS